MAFVQLGRYYTYNFSKCITRSQIDKGQIIIQTFFDVWHMPSKFQKHVKLGKQQKVF